MGDLMFGLAKSAVKETVNIARLAIEEEKKLKKSVQRDLMLISDEFEMMQSFLNIARDDHASDEMEKTCVRQVRDMALDVEDCIETVVHLGNRSSSWRRALPSCMPMHAPAAALDDAVSNIEKLKARVEAMGKRILRYRHIRCSGFKSVTQMQQLAFGNINTTHFDFLAQVRRSARARYNDVSSLSGLSIYRGHRYDEDHRLDVIAVWGTGGDLGTITIIRKAYDESSKNYGWRAWVKVPHPFSPREFLRKLLIHIYANMCGQEGSPQDALNSGSKKLDMLKTMETMATTEDGLAEEFMVKFSHQRYLLVLEDVFTMAEWDAIRAYLPDMNNRSSIVVRTQQFDVASLVLGTSYSVTELKQLSEDHSVYLFYYDIERDEEDEENKELVNQRYKEEKRWLHNFSCVGRATSLFVLHGMALSGTQKFRVVPVWGIAGVGKSSLVRKVFYEELCRDTLYFRIFGWVDVSYPFNIWDLSWRLLAYIRRISPIRVNLPEITNPIEECRRLLELFPCLLVIDGLQSTKEWDEIRTALAFEHCKRSCIIVITNEESVSTYCATQTKDVWNIRGLEFDEALVLFKQKVSHLIPPLTDEQLTPILHKCGGIAKVIVAIANSLTAEDYQFDWWRLNDSFMHELETNEDYRSLQHLFAWMQSYFRTCPDNLKPCIFYMSIFPVNHHIRRKRFVRRWIAEGYSRDTKENTAEETAEDDFSKLVKLNMIQGLQSTKTMFLVGIRMPMCQVNGFFHEYIKTRSMEENLVFALEGHCNINSQRTGRHLTIQSSWDRDRNVFESIDFSRLRSLTVFGKWESFFMSDKIKLLRVLDLEEASDLTDADLEQMVKMLPRLKFLSVRGHQKITRLPDSLGSLQHLQTLDIRHTSVSKLPKRIRELEKLQYIRAGSKDYEYNGYIDDRAPVSENLSAPSVSRRPATKVSCLSGFCRQRRIPLPGKCSVEVPAGIGKLTNLHTLGVIDFSAERGQAILKELRNLSQLHKLGVSGIDSKNSKDLLSFVSGHGHLKSLSVQLHEDNGGCLNFVTGFKPPENLQSLKLYGLGNNLPAWIEQLTSLRKLNLKMTRLTDVEIERLGYLSKLQVLCLSLKEVQDGVLKFSKGFCQLLVLEITFNPSLQRVSITNKEIPLEVLKMHSVTGVSSEVSGLDHLCQLKEVWLYGTYADALKQRLQNQLEQCYNRVKLILKEVPPS